MIDVEITRDIRDYEPKLFNLITTRQLILLIIGLIIAVPVVILVPIENLTIRMIIGTLIMGPFIACGWVTIYGMKLEKYLWQIIKSSFFMPKNRKYKPESTVDFLPAPKRRNTSVKKKITRTREYQGRK